MKNNILVWVFGILAICSLGYIGYDTFFKEENIGLKECNKEELCDNIDVCKDVSNAYYTNLKKNRDYEHIRAKFIDLFLDKNGDVYYTLSSLNDTSNYSLETTDKENEYRFDDYYFSPPDHDINANVFKGYKLNISNVLTVDCFSDSTNNYFVFIKENGNVSTVRFYESGNKIKLVDFNDNIKGLSNIVSAVSSGGNYPNFDLIDIDGNSYNLSDYV